jgi:hypothetical protein
MNILSLILLLFISVHCTKITQEQERKLEKHIEKQLNDYYSGFNLLQIIKFYLGLILNPLLQIGSIGTAILIFIVVLVGFLRWLFK